MLGALEGTLATGAQTSERRALKCSLMEHHVSDAGAVMLLLPEGTNGMAAAGGIQASVGSQKAVISLSLSTSSFHHCLLLAS